MARIGNTDLVDHSDKAQGATWSFLTNHAVVLLRIVQSGDRTIRQIADDLQLAERTVAGIIKDLRTGGYVIVRKQGRRNTYEVNPSSPLRKPSVRHLTIADTFGLLART